MLQFQSQILVDNVPDEMLDNKWECILPSMKLETVVMDVPYRPIVEEISFKNTSFSTEDVRVGTRYYSIPSDRESFGTCTLTLYCEQGMLPVYYLQAWRNLIFNPKHQYYYVNDTTDTLSYDDIQNKVNNAVSNALNGDNSAAITGSTLQSTHWKRNIEVYFYGIGSTVPVAHCTLYNAYPVSHGSFNLKYSQDPKRFRIMADFKYDNLIWDNTYRNMAIISALGAGNPAGTVLQQVLSQGLGSLMGSDSMEAEAHKAI